MGANVVPIFANLYMTQLENIFKAKHKNDKKKKTLPVLFTRCIVDGFGITKGSKIDFNYQVSESQKGVKHTHTQV